MQKEIVNQIEKDKHIVMVIEDHEMTAQMIQQLLLLSEIQYIFATNEADAFKLFEANAHLLAFVALDGNLKDPSGDHPDTLSIARAIRQSADFTGKAYVMSSRPDHNDELLAVLEHKGACVGNDRNALKLDTINAIIAEIEKIRGQSK
jgi:DNA-binding response OmpR family regulator